MILQDGFRVRKPFGAADHAGVFAVHTHHSHCFSPPGQGAALLKILFGRRVGAACAQQRAVFRRKGNEARIKEAGIAFPIHDLGGHIGKAACLSTVN